jgi:hypothetical protein
MTSAEQVERGGVGPKSEAEPPAAAGAGGVERALGLAADPVQDDARPADRGGVSGYDTARDRNGLSGSRKCAKDGKDEKKMERRIANYAGAQVPSRLSRPSRRFRTMD